MASSNQRLKKRPKNFAGKGTQGKKNYPSGRFNNYTTESYKSPPSLNYVLSNYKPSPDEAGWLASDQDFQQSNKGIYVFVGLQAAAAGALTAYGWQAKDMGSLITGSTNLVRNGLWLGAHMAVSHVPDLRVAFHTASAKTLQISKKALEKSDYIKSKTKKLCHIIGTKEQKITARANKIKAPLQEKYDSQIYRDKVHARINVFGAGSGAVVHIPQIALSSDLLVQVGASFAAAAYAKMSVDQWIESKRWGDWYNKITNKKDFKYSHEDAHLLVGYAASGEYGKDVLLKWTPPAFLATKGGCYLAETGVLASHGDPMASVAALATSGLLFTGSAIYEFKEQNGNKIKYLYNYLTRKNKDGALANDNEQYNDIYNVPKLPVMIKSEDKSKTDFDYPAL